MPELNIAEKIGELGQSIAAIKEQVGNLGSEYTAKLEQAGAVSTDLKEKTDKALSQLGEATTRISELEKRAARKKEVETAGFKGLGDYLVESEKFLAMDKGGRGSVRVKAERADITSANTTVGAGRSDTTSLVSGHRVPGIIAPPNRTFTIRDLLAQGETSSNSIEYVKETGFTNNAAPVAEARPRRSRSRTLRSILKRRLFARSLISSRLPARSWTTRQHWLRTSMRAARTGLSLLKKTSCSTVTAPARI
jgi:HK97 family phage major capsid protein